MGLILQPYFHFTVWRWRPNNANPNGVVASQTALILVEMAKDSNGIGLAGHSFKYVEVVAPVEQGSKSRSGQ